nr:unnamed protein product [Callosobruchus analis]
MASCKIALLLALAFVAIASVSCTECYICNSALSHGCDKPQTHESTHFNCNEVVPDNACVKITFTHNGKEGTSRACVDAHTSCDKIKKTLGLLHVKGSWTMAKVDDI